MGTPRARTGVRRARSVQQDWVAWLPDQQDQLFDAIRGEFEISYAILSITLSEALTLCDQAQFFRTREQAVIFYELFTRLGTMVSTVLRTIEEHGRHFGTLPCVEPLSPRNFRGETAQKISRMSHLLSMVIFQARTRFFHKLDALNEIVEELQKQAQSTSEEIAEGFALSPAEHWQALEVLDFDLHTCLGEATIILKSFFCVLPEKELETYRRKLVERLPSAFAIRPRRVNPFRRE